MRLITNILLTICLFAGSTALAGALAFTKQTNSYVARNFDWIPYFNHAKVIVNKREIQKEAVLFNSEDFPLQWVSKYGSVTFNTVGQEFPVGGMNEAGLVIEAIPTSKTKHPKPEDVSFSVNESQFVQYILDRYQTINEVIYGLQDISVQKLIVNLHYFICDAFGECIVLYYFDGRKIIIHPEELAVPALTNKPYHELIGNYFRYRGSGDYPFSMAKSDKRFILGADFIDTFQKSNNFGLFNMFQSLAQIQRADWFRTHWAIVYDQTNKKVHFRNVKTTFVKEIDLQQFDFSCRAPTMSLDIFWDEGEEATSFFTEHTPKKNKSLIDKNWLIIKTDLRNLATDYPSKFTECLE